MSACAPTVQRLAIRVARARQLGAPKAARPAIFVLVLAAHAVLILLFPPARTVSTGREEETEERTIVVFLSPALPSKASHPRQTDSQSAVTRQVSSRPGASEPVPPPASTPQQLPEAPRAIDWMEQAEEAAAHRIEAQQEAQRRASALSSRVGPRGQLSTAPAPEPQFGWSEASIHRIEPLPQGGLLLRLDDRCSIVLAIPPLGGCRLGKIEARGDLFEHMDDPPAFGDWKDR